MSLVPGYNPEGLGREFCRQMTEARKALTEEEALKHVLRHALQATDEQVQTIAIQALAKAIRDGVVTRTDLAELRKNLVQ